MNIRRILVTGAAGSVGSNLVRELAKDPRNRVAIFIMDGEWHPFLDGLDLTVFCGDIRNRQDIMQAMKGCHQVYHVAGIVSYNLLDNDRIYSTHVDGVKNILSAAKRLKVKKVVVTASTAGIGIPESPDAPLDEDASFDYGKYQGVMYMYSKHLKIKVCQDFAAKGLDVSIISPTTIYGAGDMSMHIGKVVKKIKDGKMRFAPPGGNAVVSVEDTVDAMILIMERGRSGENYIIADEFIPYIDMFNRLAVLTDSRKVSRTLPTWLLPPSKFALSLAERALLPFGKKPLLSPASVNFSFKHRYFDSSKIRNELGWQPKVSFEETMRNAIVFYEEQGLL